MFPNTFFGMPSAWSASCLADTTHISRGMNPQDFKCGPTTERPYYVGVSDDPFTEVVRATRFRGRVAIFVRRSLT